MSDDKVKEQIINQLKENDAAGGDGVPPGFERWNPPLSGDIDIEIKANGEWIHEGGLIKREKLVRLFSTILRCENDGQHYLITPVEKWRIRVEKAPFLIVDYRIQAVGKNQVVELKTNVGEWLPVDQAHPLEVTVDRKTHEPTPLFLVRAKLQGLISRAVYYHLVDAAEERQSNGLTEVGLWSCGVFFVLG